MQQRASRYMRTTGLQSPGKWVPLWGNQDLTPWPADHPSPYRSANGWQEGEFVLLYSGNMGLGHRFDEFLAAAEQLGSAGPRWVFAGNGPRRAEIATFAHNHPNARISLLPYVPNEKLRESLCAANVHLVSQQAAWQGLIVPSKIQSSFCVGKPVIFVGGRENEIADWVNESGGGWIVPEGDVPALLGAVEAAKDPSERHKRGLAARAFAQAHFSYERNCANIAALIEDLPRLS
jgi:glycosyltransferase involved in cell wall biosynthesis